jgi:hypothetical protein
MRDAGDNPGKTLHRRNRMRVGAREQRMIEARVRVHKVRTAELQSKGFDYESASHLSFCEIMDGKKQKEIAAECKRLLTERKRKIK